MAGGVNAAGDSKIGRMEDWKNGKIGRREGWKGGKGAFTGALSIGPILAGTGVPAHGI